MKVDSSATSIKIPDFNRDFFSGDQTFSVIGTGSIGGKAMGLAFFRERIAARFDSGAFTDLTVAVPRLAVIGTDVFDSFMKRNSLYDTATSGIPDDRIAAAFQKGEFPAEVLGDVRALIAGVRTPLAVRSSSLLEDASERPFAGVYGTKMTPNNQFDVDSRFRKLIEAIKFVYASTYFAEARSYRKTVEQPESSEKMAVIIQEVVGRRHSDRYYPNLSGVARSYNFYPTGKSKPQDGVVDLALGLGKQIVDGGAAWSYSPAFPKAPRPFNNIGDMLKSTQTGFWAVYMGPMTMYDPLQEAEYLVNRELADAEYDDTLRFVASTFDAESNRLVTGVNRPGPRVINFAPILQSNLIRLNDALKQLLKICEEVVGAPVEIEFAVTIDPRGDEPARVGFLQVRPLVVSSAEVEVTEVEIADPRGIVVSETVLGNDAVESITDIVYARPENFDVKQTPAIAKEMDGINQKLVQEERPYVLIGFGRWGTSDPWGGIPVVWSQISNAKVIVEASIETMQADLSQGSHFFHNVTSFRVLYFSQRRGGKDRIDWDFLNSLPAITETHFLRHVRLERPAVIKADGRTGRGVVLRQQ